MVHQEAGSSIDARLAARGGPDAVAVVAYRSRAIKPPSDLELDRLLRSAQERNNALGVTGLLVYDQGFFYQWLEGPRLAIMNLWQSIRTDPRHQDVKILREGMVARRFFKGWNMRLARRTRGDIAQVLAIMDMPQEVLGKLTIQPSAMSGNGWDRVFGEVVIPRLRPLHAPELRDASKPSPGIWHAQREAGAALAGILLDVDPDATVRYVDALIAEGAGLEPLYQEVFAPAARFLGGLWEDDRCNDFNVSLAMGRLQLEVHRLSAALAEENHASQQGHAVLVAPQPGEPHGLNATMCSELFQRYGWQVSSEIPSSDEDIREMLHEQWFDVLELSLSGALLRERELPALRLTIRAARDASKNPALAVIVDGRSFFERPRAFQDVGADVGCGSPSEAVPAAERLLNATPLPMPSVSTG
jgi:methanogenic corrinoid protein MtbC1